MSLRDLSLQTLPSMSSATIVQEATRAFERLALQIEPSQLFADRFLRGLESLGHIEVRRDLRTLAPLSWEIAPSALAQTREECRLTGFRSRRLYDALKSAAAEFGLPMEYCSQAVAPDRIRFKECDLAGAERLARYVFDDTGVTVTIVPEASLAVALLLPPLSAVIDALPRSAMTGFRSANRWDGACGQMGERLGCFRPGCLPAPRRDSHILHPRRYLMLQTA